ncbi:MAG TPA: hypothetical protein VGE07_04430 [Herpetosiphonaceae bacterium]
MELSHRWRAGVAATALGFALTLAGGLAAPIQAQQSYGYATRIEYGCRGRSITEWKSLAPVTGVLNHEKWVRDGSSWVRANARRTTQGPKPDGYIDHQWDGSRGRTNRIIALHTWSDRAGVMLSSTGDFYCL